MKTLFDDLRMELPPLHATAMNLLAHLRERGVMVAQGLLVGEEGGWGANRYRLVTPDLPAVPAELTPLARQALDWLTGRSGETLSGLAGALRVSREEAREALAPLLALDLLAYSGVGSIVVYRLKESRLEERNAAD